MSGSINEKVQMLQVCAAPMSLWIVSRWCATSEQVFLRMHRCVCATACVFRFAVQCCADRRQMVLPAAFAVFPSLRSSRSTISTHEGLICGARTGPQDQARKCKHSGRPRTGFFRRNGVALPWILSRARERALGVCLVMSWRSTDSAAILSCDAQNAWCECECVCVSVRVCLRDDVCVCVGPCKRSSISPGMDRRVGTKIRSLADSTSLAAARRQLFRPTAMNAMVTSLRRPSGSTSREAVGTTTTRNRLRDPGSPN